MERQTSTEIFIAIAETGDARVQFNKATGNYLFNGKIPREIPTDYYQEIYERFEGFLFVQLRTGLSFDEVVNYIERTVETSSRLIAASHAHRVHFLFSKRDGLLSQGASTTHDDILKIFSTQKTVLSRMLLQLYEVKEKIEVDDVEPEQIVLDTEVLEDKENIDVLTIPFDSGGKITFNMGKKETLMLFFILEKEGLLTFESEDKRRMFLESNVNYTEQRKNPNHGSLITMAGVSSELANFKSVAHVKSNNKTLETLLKRLSETIQLFQFKK